MSRNPSSKESCAADVNRLRMLQREGVEAIQTRDFETACACFLQSLTIQPDNHVSHRCLATAYFGLGNAGDALRSLQRAIQLNPSDAETWYEMANLLAELNQCNTALQSYCQAIRLNPTCVEAVHNRADLLLSMGRVKEAITEYRYILANLPYCRQSHDNLLLALHYLPEMSSEQLFAEHREYGRRIAQQPAMRLSHSPPPPLRVGFVSADFRRHSVAYFISPLLEDTEETEIYCYASVSNPDHTTETIKHNASHWRDISRLSDYEAAEMIRRDGIHVLVDLSGHTAGNRLGIFTYRPARVSATYLGYPDTTGIPQIDYRITAKTAEPPGAEEYYTEQSAFLPHGFLCYTPPVGSPQPRSCKDSRPATYGSFNNIAKLSEQTIEAWCDILKQSPHSRLLLKYGRLNDPTVAECLSGKFTGRGIARERIEFRGEIESVEKHLECYHSIDIALDPIGYNGTTTTCEALWMGVPVVTCLGDRHCQMVGASILRQMELPSWITTSPDEYVKTAVEWGKRPPALRGEDLRKHMLAGPLCRRKAYSREFRGLMYRLWEQGLSKPAP